MTSNQKKLHKQKKREKQKRVAREHRATLEHEFTPKEKSIGKMQIGIVVLIMIAASAFIFSQMS